MIYLPGWLIRIIVARTDETPALEQRGILGRPGYYTLCAPTADVARMKIVTVTPELCERYNRVMGEYADIQDELRALPKSLRPRQPKRKAEVVGADPRD